MTTTNNTAKLISQLNGQVTGLVMQFILGISLTTLVHYNPDKHTIVQTVLLTTHIIVAVLLFIGAIATIAAARRLGRLRGLSVLGLTAVIAAIGSGSVAAGGRSGLAVFLMALLFIVAILIYGSGLLQLNKSQAIK